MGKNKDKNQDIFWNRAKELTEKLPLKYKRYIRLFEDGVLRLHNRTIYDWFTRETFNFRDYYGSTLIEEFLDHGRLALSDDGRLEVRRNNAVDDKVCFKLEMISPGEERGKALAKDADAVIYCSGNYPVQTAKECFDRKTLALNVQQGMTMKLAEANPSTVLLLVSSYPYSVVKGSEAAAAVLYSSHAGAELGTAVAKTVSGENNPSGHTPLTWYRSELELPDIFEYDIEGSGATYMYFKGRPLYPFGFGLSYSEFEFGELSVAQQGEKLSAEIKVKNVSETDGACVVQLYYTVKESAFSRAKKKLCAFSRTELKAGEEKKLELEINPGFLKVFDVHSGKMLLEEAEYIFMAGRSSDDIVCTAKLKLSGEKQAGRSDEFAAAMYDSLENASLFYSKKACREYVRVTDWSGSVTFKGVDLSGAKAVEFTASSIMGRKKISLWAGEKELECEIAPSDAYDDFTTYRIEIDGLTCDSLIFNLPQFVGIMDVRIVR